MIIGFTSRSGSSGIYGRLCGVNADMSVFWSFFFLCFVWFFIKHRKFVNFTAFIFYQTSEICKLSTFLSVYSSFRKFSFARMSLARSGEFMLWISLPFWTKRTKSAKFVRFPRSECMITPIVRPWLTFWYLWLSERVRSHIVRYILLSSFKITKNRLARKNWRRISFLRFSTEWVTTTQARNPPHQERTQMLALWACFSVFQFFKGAQGHRTRSVELQSSRSDVAILHRITSLYVLLRREHAIMGFTAPYALTRRFL